MTVSFLNLVFVFSTFQNVRKPFRTKLQGLQCFLKKGIYQAIFWQESMNTHCFAILEDLSYSAWDYRHIAKTCTRRTFLSNSTLKIIWLWLLIHESLVHTLFHYSPIGIIVTLKICFYFISCRKSILIYAKLYLNENVLSEIEIYKNLKVFCSSLQSLGKFGIFQHSACARLHTFICNHRGVP